MSENLNRPPAGKVDVVVGSDVTAGNTLDIRPLGPPGSRYAVALRWNGSGTATLWYLPVTSRTSFTASETAASVPKDGAILDGAGGTVTGKFLKLVFSTQYESRVIPGLITHIHGDSTAGAWEVLF